MYESCWEGPAGEKSHFLTMLRYYLLLDLEFKEVRCDIIAGPSPPSIVNSLSRLRMMECENIHVPHSSSISVSSQMVLNLEVEATI